MFFGPLRDDITGGAPLSLNLVSTIVFHWHLPIVTRESTCSVVDDVIHVIWLMVLFLYFWSRLKSLYASKIFICQFEDAFKVKTDSMFSIFRCNIDYWDYISLISDPHLWNSFHLWVNFTPQYVVSCRWGKVVILGKFGGIDAPSHDILANIFQHKYMGEISLLI